MLGKEIKFPSNLQSLTNDGPLASRRDSNAILIYYYDGNECTSCNIANLNNIINIYQSPNLSIIPIFSINDDEHYLNLTTLLNNNSIKTKELIFSTNSASIRMLQIKTFGYKNNCITLKNN